MHIEEKEQAINRHKEIAEQYKGRSLLVYTDVNAHGGHVTAAVVARDRYRHLYMGIESLSTVYVVELQGIRMDLSLAMHNARVGDVFIFIDNQDTIRAIHCP